MPTSLPPAREAGFMLVFVVILTALLLIALSVAAPVVARDLRRDKEVESQHRADQYVRALRLYYRKNKNYPVSIEALEKTNNIRFLRKRYVDPLTGKSEWRIIRVGQNQTTVKGFFGQPLGGIATTGAGTNLGSASALGTGFGGTNSSTGGTSSTIGSTTGLAAGFQGATVSSSVPTNGTGAIPGPGVTSGTASSGAGAGTSSSGGVGQIMGVGTSRTGTSLLTPNAQTTYETWEFLYDPKIELLYAKSNLLGGSVSSQSASSFGSDAATGQSNSSSGSNSTPSSGSSPGTPISPASGAPK
jgi:type II secretory pathway pseudopilin PulG